MGFYVVNGGFNYILKNNFIDNKRHAFFDTAFRNHWVNNYWDEAELNSYRINGMISFYKYDIWGEIIWELHIPWINFDWNPAKEPYDINVTQNYDIDDYMRTIDNPLLEQFPLLQKLIQQLSFGL